MSLLIISASALLFIIYIDFTIDKHGSWIAFVGAHIEMPEPELVSYVNLLRACLNSQ